MKPKVRILSVLVITILLVVIITTVAYAAASSYYIDLTAVENGTSSYSTIPLYFDTDMSNMYHSGYLSNTLYSNLTVDSGTVPFMVAARGLLAASALSQGSTRIYRYTMNTDTPLKRTAIVLGLGGSLAVNDNSNLEPSYQADMRIAGYFDTSKTDNIGGKTNSFLVKAAGSNIVETRIPSVLNGLLNLKPVTDAYFYNLAGTPPHYTKLIDDNDSTWVGCPTGPPNYGDLYCVVTPPSISLAKATIITVKAYLRAASSIGSVTAYALAKLGGSTTNASVNATTTWTWYSVSLSRPGGGSWTFKDLFNAQFGVRSTYNGSGTSQISEFYVEVTYTTTYYSPYIALNSTDTTLQYTYRGNLVQNGDFETTDPPPNWSLYGSGASYAQSSSYARNGSYSLALTRNGTDCGVSQTLGGTELRGKVLRAGAWVYATVANTTSLVITDNAGSVAVSAYHSGGSRWEFLSASAIVQSTATAPSVNFTVRNSNTTSYLDAVVVTVDRDPPSSRLLVGGYENLLTNGNFEVGHISPGLGGVVPSTGAIGYWYASSGVSTFLSSSPRKVGTYSANISTTATGQYLFQTVYTDATPTYPRYITFGAWIRAPSGSSVDLAVTGTNTGLHASNPLIGDNTWQWIEFSTLVKDTSIECRIRSVSGAVNFYVDNAVVQYGQSIVPASPTWPDCGYDSFVIDGNFEGSLAPEWYASGGSLTVSTDRAVVGSYSAKATNPGGATYYYAYDFYQYPYSGLLTNYNLTAGAWVWASVPNKVRLIISFGDGAEAQSSYHTGDSTWQWLTVSRTIQTPYQTWCNAGLRIDDGGGTAYFDAFMFGYNLPTTPNYTLSGVIQPTHYSKVPLADTSNGWVWMSDATPYLWYIDYTGFYGRAFYQADRIIGYASTGVGTVSTTSGSTTVTGTGTLWDSRLNFGRIYINGYGYATVAKVVSSNVLQVSSPINANLSGATYNITKCIWNTWGDIVANASTAVEVTWGTNPNNVTTSVGPLTSYRGAAAVGNGDLYAPNVVRGITGVTGPDSEPVNTNFPLYGVFALMASLLGVPVKTMINVGVIFVMLGTGAVCIATRLSPIVTSGILITLYIILNIMHIVDYWMVFMLVALLLIAWLLPRQTAYL